MSQQINLFNPVFLKKKKYFSALTMVQALGMILAGSLVLSVYIHFHLSGLAREAEASGLQLKAAQDQLARVNALSAQRTKNKALEEDAQKAEEESASLQRQFDVLKGGDFGNTEGYSEYFRAFARQVVDGLWLTGLSLTAGGNEVGIHGRTLRPELVPVYINRLKSEPVMKGKAFATLEMQAPSESVSEGASNNNNASPRKPREHPAYIEFHLQSSNSERERKQSEGMTR